MVICSSSLKATKFYSIINFKADMISLGMRKLIRINTSKKNKNKNWSWDFRLF